ncbi:hypothetical protein [Aeromonas hydrophila]|uniref:hypothetical protein n=1 Tax=Aeromonas hydrophila TaxID=644 RepID=UPI001934438C|nr:hypothetical protein [Aeromonas hydrophila]MBM0511876.1 hypothetical protein [Aeromonas hydrophila]MBW3771373.1 hypothetical protein [Aeromonas hydrophila]
MKFPACNKFIFYICRGLNLLPILHISNDKEFDSVSTLTELTDLRISLIALPLGDKYLYFVSYCTSSGFNFVFNIKLSDIQPPQNQSELTEKKENFLTLKDDDKGSQSQLRIELLKHKYAECQGSINTLNNKVNSYIAIALVYAGLFALLLKLCLRYQDALFGWLTWSLFLISGISLANVLILLHRYLQVKQTLKSKFSDFKENPSWKSLAKSIYIDWITAKDEQIEAASIVKNIEKYFIRSIASALFLLFSIFLSHTYKITSPLIKGDDSHFIILSQNGDFSPQELLNLSNAISSENNVTFILSKSNASGQKAIKSVVGLLNISKQHSIVTVSDDLFNKKAVVAKIQE